MPKSPASSHLPRRAGRSVRAPFLIILTLGSTFFSAFAATQSGTSEAQPPTSSDATATQPVDLADQVVHDVLGTFQRGMETHNLSRVLSVFDAQNMTDYDEFREEMAAFLRLHDNIKFRYQLFQVSADKDVGFAVADVEMDPEPRDILPTEQRRSTQMRFELRRTPAGWRAIGLKPMDFFTQ